MKMGLGWKGGAQWFVPSPTTRQHKRLALGQQETTREAQPSPQRQHGLGLSLVGEGDPQGGALLSPSFCPDGKLKEEGALAVSSAFIQLAGSNFSWRGITGKGVEPHSLGTQIGSPQHPSVTRVGVGSGWGPASILLPGFTKTKEGTKQESGGLHRRRRSSPPFSTPPRFLFCSKPRNGKRSEGGGCHAPRQGGSPF